jgi:hypothetical protein
MMQLTQGLSGEKWQQRWVSLTPTHLLIFPSSGRPRLGEEPKTAIYLGTSREMGSPTRVEEVPPRELRSPRPALAVVESEEDGSVVLSAPSAQRLAAWRDALQRQCFLSLLAEARGLRIDADGNMFDADMQLVGTAEAAWAAEKQKRGERPKAAEVEAEEEEGEKEEEEEEEEEDVRVVTTAGDGQTAEQLTRALDGAGASPPTGTPRRGQEQQLSRARTSAAPPSRRKPVWGAQGGAPVEAPLGLCPCGWRLTAHEKSDRHNINRRLQFDDITRR